MSDFEQKLFARQATAAMKVERERATYGARSQVDRERAERRERLLDEAHIIGRQAVDVLKKHGVPSEPLWGYDRVDGYEVPASVRLSPTPVNPGETEYTMMRRIGVAWRTRTMLKHFVMDSVPDSFSISGITEDGCTLNARRDQTRLYPDGLETADNPVVSGLFASIDCRCEPHDTKKYYESPNFQDDLLAVIADKKAPHYIHYDDGRVYRAFE